jgi:hypothetical protein
MKPNKEKNPNVKNVNKWRGYYLEDTDCIYCLHYKGKKRGCSLTACSCEDIKIEAIANGRFKRKRGIERWDM